RIRHDRKGLPSPLVTDHDRHRFVFLTIDRFQDRFRRTKRHLMFARPSSTNDTYTNFVHCFMLHPIGLALRVLNTSEMMLAAFSTSSWLTSTCVTMRIFSLSTGT